MTRAAVALGAAMSWLDAHIIATTSPTVTVGVQRSPDGVVGVGMAIVVAVLVALAYNGLLT